jgi:hypothetical protein
MKINYDIYGGSTYTFTHPCDGTFTVFVGGAKSTPTLVKHDTVFQTAVKLDRRSAASIIRAARANYK